MTLEERQTTRPTDKTHFIQTASGIVENTRGGSLRQRVGHLRLRAVGGGFACSAFTGKVMQ